VLKPGGQLHIWHLISRARVNEIHATASAAVNQDRLPPAEETAAMLGRLGFEIASLADTANTIWLRRSNRHASLRCKRTGTTYGMQPRPGGQAGSPDTPSPRGRCIRYVHDCASYCAYRGAGNRGHCYGWLVASRPTMKTAFGFFLLGLMLFVPTFFLLPLMPPNSASAAAGWKHGFAVSANLLVRGMSGVLISMATVASVSVSDLREGLTRLPLPASCPRLSCRSCIRPRVSSTRPSG